jgi:hypothetical protein
MRTAGFQPFIGFIDIPSLQVFLRETFYNRIIKEDLEEKFAGL